jgi:phosphonopyruvate decarboxylase
VTLRPADAFAAFRRAGVDFWAGVPDSLLKDFCRYVEVHAAEHSHVIAANEGGAVAIAAGHHLATGAVCGVYLQNSGLGNTINPLVSLADPAVYEIPLVLLIGWRGEPGTQDEPQHRRQGETTLQLLETMGVPTRVVPRDIEGFGDAVDWAVTTAKARAGPTALVVPAGSFEPYEGAERSDPGVGLPAREDTLVAVAEGLPDDFAIVATTGKTSRELYEHRRRAGGPTREFLTVGSMGHASQIALGIALARPAQRTCIFDGDGAAVMHLGSLAVIGEHAPPNLYHVIFNNRAHESVGGQPTPTRRLDFPGLALAAGYRRATSVDTLDAVAPAVAGLTADGGPALLEIRIRQGSRPDLGRPEEPPGESRRRFTAWLER